jgi:diguanylate cyclase (GGDEF)-like protein
MLLSMLEVYFFAAVCVAIFFAAYSLSKGRSLLVKIFAAVNFCVSVYLFGYLMELNSVTLERMAFWNQIQYLTLPFYPGLWVLLVLVHSKAVRTVNASVLIPIFAVPTITFLLRFTNGMHRLFYSSMTLRENAFFPTLALGKGPWYYVNAAYLLFSFLIAVYLYLSFSLKGTRERRISYIILTAGALLPIVGLGLILADFGHFGIDYAAMMMPVSLLFVHSAFFRYDFLEIKSLAREVLFESSSDAMILADDAGALTDHNRQARELFPELSAAASGMPLESLFADRGDFLELLRIPMESRDPAAVYQSEDNRFYRIKDLELRNVFGNPAGRLITLSDCTEERLEWARLKERASTDELTGLFNRASFSARAEDEFSRSQRHGSMFSLIMMDIDHFKSVNDTYGHAAGDEVLRFLGGELRYHFRSTDLSARIGGEELAVILPGAALDAAFAAAEKFRMHIELSPVVFEASEIRFTLSAGVVRYSPAFGTFSDMMKAADMALYESKRRGRNRTTPAYDS